MAYMPSGQAVAEFSVATDESYKDKDGNKVEKTEWLNIKAFGKTAEFCGNYLGKGRLVYIEGKIATRSWDDKNGQKRYMTEIVVSAPGHCVQGLDRAPNGEAPAARAAKEEPQGKEFFPTESTGLDSVPF